mmetsp:Transcript_16190/g.18014  ORF Transcript_16190/g.18014 Transcript_16190/m.18014 type:complete len:276 (-) Transcript_16190:108-935(-)
MLEKSRMSVVIPKDLRQFMREVKSQMSLLEDILKAEDSDDTVDSDVKEQLKANLTEKRVKLTDHITELGGDDAHEKLRGLLLTLYDKLDGVLNDSVDFVNEDSSSSSEEPKKKTPRKKTTATEVVSPRTKKKRKKPRATDSPRSKPASAIIEGPDGVGATEAKLISMSGVYPANNIVRVPNSLRVSSNEVEVIDPMLANNPFYDSTPFQSGLGDDPNPPVNNTFYNTTPFQSGLGGNPNPGANKTGLDMQFLETVQTNTPKQPDAQDDIMNWLLS